MNKCFYLAVVLVSSGMPSRGQSSIPAAAQRPELTVQQGALCDAFALERRNQIKYHTSRIEASKNPIILTEFQKAHDGDLAQYQEETTLRTAEVLGGSFQKWRGNLSFGASTGGVNPTLKFSCPESMNFDFERMLQNERLILLPHFVQTITVFQWGGTSKIALGSPIAELLKNVHQGEIVQASGSISSTPDRQTDTLEGVYFAGVFTSLCASGGQCASVDSGGGTQRAKTSTTGSQGASTSELVHGGSTVEGRHTLVIALEGCRASGSAISCRYKITRAGDFNGTLMTNWDDWQTALIDNLGDSHSLARTYIVRDDGAQVEMLPLSRGQSTWLVQEFDGSSNEITSARILFGKFNSELQGPVRHEAAYLQTTMPTPNRPSTSASPTGGDLYHPLTVPEDMQRQKLIYHPKPVYTAFARSARLQGEIRFKVLVDKDGTVGYVELISGNRLLATGAIDAVKQYRYSPTVINGVPKQVWTEVVVSFP